MGLRVPHTKLWSVIEHAQDPLPLPLDQLPPRKELETLLTRILLGILIPPKIGRGSIRVRYPNTVAFFVRFVAHVHTVGYPTHWIVDYLRTVLNDALTTGVAPYIGVGPIPLDYSGTGPERRPNLHPWRLELEMIFAMCHSALPFPVPGPDDFTRSHEDIGLFEAPLPANRTGLGLDPAFALLFFKESLGCTMFWAEDVVSKILEGQLRVKKGDVYVLNTLDALDGKLGVVRWRMARQRVRKMMDEKWAFMAYRFDMDQSSRRSFTFGLPGAYSIIRFLERMLRSLVGGIYVIHTAPYSDRSSHIFYNHR